MLLKGKSALVIGGGEFAAAIVREFTDQGAKVLVADSSAEAAKQLALENSAHFSEVEVSNNSSMAMLAYDLADKIGELDCIVNTSAMDDIAVRNDANFEGLQQIQLKSNYLLVKHFAPEMRSRKTGVILSILGGNSMDDTWQTAANAFVEEAMNALSATHIADGVKFETLTATLTDTPSAIATQACNICADHAH